MWAIGAAIAYCLIWWSRRQAIQKAEATAELELFMTQPLQQVQPQTALLRPNEKAYATIQGELKETKTVGYSAGTAGVSVRVAKGVTLRTGGIKGGAMKGLVSVAAGELVITDQRIIFAGDRKSFAVANEDLLNTTNYADGFSFTDGKTTYTISTRSGKAHTTFAMVLHRILRNKTA